MPSFGSNSSGREPGSSTGRPIQLPRAAQARERRPAVAVVDDRADAERAVRAATRPRARPAATSSLKCRDARVVGAGCGRHLLELAAVVEGEHAEIARLARQRRSRGAARRCARPRRGARAVAARARNSSSSASRRHRGRAAVARHDDRAAGVAAARRSARPAGPRSSRSDSRTGRRRRRRARSAPRPGNRRRRGPVDARIRDRALEDDAAGDAALHHDRRRGARADGAAAPRARLARRRRRWISSSVPTTRSQSGRKACSSRVTAAAACRALGAAAVAGQAPEHRAVVDVEHDAQPMLLGERDRAASRRRARASVDRCVPVSASAFAPRERRGVDVGRLERHVGAVLADRRCAGSCSRSSMPSSTRPVRRRGSVRTAPTFDALGGERLAHEAAHVLVADARQHRDLEPEPREPDRDVRRRSRRDTSRRSARPRAARRAPGRTGRPRRGRGR